MKRIRKIWIGIKLVAEKKSSRFKNLEGRRFNLFFKGSQVGNQG